MIFLRDTEREAHTIYNHLAARAEKWRHKKCLHCPPHVRITRLETSTAPTPSSETRPSLSPSFRLALSIFLLSRFSLDFNSVSYAFFPPSVSLHRFFGLSRTLRQSAFVSVTVCVPLQALFPLVWCKGTFFTQACVWRAGWKPMMVHMCCRKGVHTTLQGDRACLIFVLRSRIIYSLPHFSYSPQGAISPAFTGLSASDVFLPFWSIIHSQSLRFQYHS